MKKFLRSTALILALVLVMGSMAFAAGETTITPNDAPNTTVTFDPANGFFDITYENPSIKADGMYMAFVVTANGEGKYIPDSEHTYYINQYTAVDGTLTMEKIYPKALVNSKVYVSGTGLTGLTEIAEIKVPYILGDVYPDGKVNTSDATALMQHLAGIQELTGNSLLAADVYSDNKVNTSDATALMQYLAGIITEF